MNSVVQHHHIFRVFDFEQADTDSHSGFGSYAWNRYSRKIGSSVAQYRLKIATHQSAMSDYTRWEDNEVTSVPGQFSGRFNIANYRPPAPFTTATVESSGCHAAARVESFDGPVGGELSFQARSLLNVAFLQRLNAVEQHFTGGVFLGELGQTLHGLRNPARSLFNGLSSYLRTVKNRSRGLNRGGTRQRRLRALNDMINGSWLEYTYAWAPLISDIQSAGDAYNHFFDANTYVGEKVSALRSERLFGHVVEKGYFTPDGYFKYDMIIDNETLISGRMFGFVSRETPTPYSFLRNVGLAPRDFIPTVWNLLPFSFVADYFVNIGNCLEAGGVSTTGLRWLGISYKNEYKYIYTSKLDVADFLSNYNSYPISSPTIIANTPSSVTGFATEMRRETLNPAVDLWVIPVIQLPTLRHVANMGALAAHISSTRTDIRRSLRV